MNSAQLKHIFTAATGCVCCSLTDAVLKKMVDQDEYAMSGFINELLVLVGLIKVRCAYVVCNSAGACTQLCNVNGGRGLVTHRLSLVL